MTSQRLSAFDEFNGLVLTGLALKSALLDPWLVRLNTREPNRGAAFPTASVIALLVNPANPRVAEININLFQTAARALGLELHVLNASTESEFDGAFAKVIQLRAGGLVIGPESFFTSRNEQLAALSVRHAVPAIYQSRSFVASGDLLSYGADSADAYRLTGIYVGRVLKGEKPADLPVQQATKVELYINLKTAKALSITIPNTLIERADEVFE